MQRLFIALLIFIPAFSVGQNNSNLKFSINGSTNISSAFLVCPLTSETIAFDSANIYKWISQNPKRKVFFCYNNSNKSRIYNLNYESLNERDSLNFIIPDVGFYKNLYRFKICPFCYKKDSVVSILYGLIFPTADLMRKVRKKEIILGGCEERFTGSMMYCKRDYAYF